MNGARAAVLALLLATATGAQSFTVCPSRDVPQGEQSCLQLEVSAYPLAQRPGGLGWIDVHVQNPTAVAHELLVELGASRVSSERRLSLGPGERRRLVLPLPNDQLGGETFMATVDGGDRLVLDVSLSIGGTVSVLVVSDDPSGAGLELSQAAERALSPGGGFTSQQVTAAALPESWTLISGADLLIVDGRTPLPASAQQVLLDAAAAGAELFVAHAELMQDGAGPLCERLKALTTDFDGSASGLRRVGVPLGFGGLSADVGRDGPEESTSDLLLLPALPGDRSANSGFPADAWLQRPSIPGLNDVPAGLFLVLLLGFVVFVAARSFQLLRARRPLRLLVLLPGSGLAMTAGLLVAGLLSEGVGLRGARRSLTLLDQRTHRAVAVCQSSVYAALAGGALQPRAETLLTSGDLSTGYRRGALERVWRVDLDAGGRVSSGAVPPRTPTQLTTSSVGLARERLRFRRVDGAIEVVADAELRPVAGAGALVLRDFDGTWYDERVDGRLQACDDSDGSYGSVGGALYLALDALAVDEADSSTRLVVRGGHLAKPTPSSTNPVGQLHQLLHALPPGAYAAIVQDEPSVDTLGLDVDWLQQVHVVVGLLAPEDVDG
ncbi:MAG TPA: hypothetical protein VFY71_14865 [Planctomycetota bacterium]|nr:hypothetical protein [Planctomycetota bacterium]